MCCVSNRAPRWRPKIRTGGTLPTAKNGTLHVFSICQDKFGHLGRNHWCSHDTRMCTVHYKKQKPNLFNWKFKKLFNYLYKERNLPSIESKSLRFNRQNWTMRIPNREKTLLLFIPCDGCQNLTFTVPSPELSRPTFRSRPRLLQLF